jgi:hypothetical protein
MTDMIVDDATRKAVAEFLPRAVESVFQSYMEFMEKGVSGKGKDETKDFAEHHKAGKIAIAHMELLFKMGRWAKIDLDDRQKEIHALILKARDEVGKYRETEDAFEEEIED